MIYTYSVNCWKNGRKGQSTDRHMARVRKSEKAEWILKMLAPGQIGRFGECVWTLETKRMDTRIEGE